MVRYVVKPLAWAAAAILLIWVILWIYVETHEEDLKNRISKAIHEKARGAVKIQGLSVSFFRTFPILSLQLQGVVIKDSVAAFAHKDFLHASDIYLRISIPGLINGGSPIGKILMRNGGINVMSDTLGNTNEYIFKTKPREGRQVTTSFPDVELQNVSVAYLNPKRKKDYSAIIHSLKSSAVDRDGILHIKTNMRTLAKNVSFNTIRGAYLKEKMLEGKFGVTYDRESQELLAGNIKL